MLARAAFNQPAGAVDDEMSVMFKRGLASVNTKPSLEPSLFKT